jgi:hypothetical protein
MVESLVSTPFGLEAHKRLAQLEDLLEVVATGKTIGKPT